LGRFAAYTAIFGTALSIRAYARTNPTALRYLGSCLPHACFHGGVRRSLKESQPAINAENDIITSKKAAETGESYVKISENRRGGKRASVAENQASALGASKGPEEERKSAKKEEISRKRGKRRKSAKYRGFGMASAANSKKLAAAATIISGRRRARARRDLDGGRSKGGGIVVCTFGISPVTAGAARACSVCPN